MKAVSRNFIWVVLISTALKVNALNWIPTSAPTNSWNKAACSADGTTFIAQAGTHYGGTGPLLVSTNSGATWETNAPVLSWQSVATSSNGRILFAGYSVIPPSDGFRGGIYVSTNSGVVWTPTTAPSQNWLEIACSADGTKIIGASQFGMFRSLDLGSTWEPINTPTNNEFSLACSADGTRIIAAGGMLYNGPVYVSTNSGATWTSTSAPFEYWRSVASSADGMTLLAGGYQYIDGSGGVLYVSRDGGITWNSNNVPDCAWTSVASSADGTRLFAVGIPRSSPPPSSCVLYSSTDSGTTWVKSDGCPGDIACSADGGQLVTSGNTIYIAHIPVSTTNATGFVAAWLAANFPNTPSDQRGLLDTPFGDGVPNLVKYAFDVDLQHPTGENQQFRLSTVNENGSTYSNFTFKRRRIPGLNYIPEVSGDLQNWYSDIAHLQIISLVALDADFDSVVVKDLTRVTPSNPRFGRVRLVVTDN